MASYTNFEATAALYEQEMSWSSTRAVRQWILRARVANVSYTQVRSDLLASLERLYGAAPFSANNRFPLGQVWVCLDTGEIPNILLSIQAFLVARDDADIARHAGRREAGGPVGPDALLGYLGALNRFSEALRASGETQTIFEDRLALNWA